jgi:polar amino acid transport system permease protein
LTNGFAVKAEPFVLAFWKGCVCVDFEYLLKLLLILLEGMGTSLKVFALTLIFSIPLGMIVAVGKMSRHVIINFPIRVYISIMRGTPLILQLIFIYFGPYYIFDVTYDRFTAAIIAFSINYAAYFAEIFRGGMQSMPLGQYEAAQVLGYTKSQTFFRIILPQVVKRVIPASANEVITLIKDTALAQTIGVIELFSLAQKQSSFIFSVMPLFVAGVFYYILNLVVSGAFSFIEKKLNYYR